jgi:hypothetical protein
MADRHVRFALGEEGDTPFAMQLRITPQLLAALRSSAATNAGNNSQLQQQQQQSLQLDLASHKAVSYLIIHPMNLTLYNNYANETN